jgi:hypothetical protein
VLHSTALIKRHCIDNLHSALARPRAIIETAPSVPPTRPGRPRVPTRLDPLICLPQVIQLVLVLCNLATRDADLMTYAMGPLFKAGLFPSKLPAAAQAEWWALLWQRAGKRAFYKLS